MVRLVSLSTRLLQNTGINGKKNSPCTLVAKDKPRRIPAQPARPRDAATSEAIVASSSAASRASQSACEISALVTMSVSSFARSSGIVPTAMPPAPVSAGWAPLGVDDAGGKVEIPTIPAPKTNFKNVADAIRLALGHELKVTSQINGLVDLALKESDHISRDMLSWFVKEQLEEVSSMDNLLKVVIRAGESNLVHVEDYITRLEAKTAKREAAVGD